MKKVVLIVSDVNKALTFEWQADYLREYFDISFILLNNEKTALEEYLEQIQVPCFRLEGSSRFRLWRNCYRLLKVLRPDLVHCHLRRAEIIGIPAARWAGIKNRVYTRHSSTYNHLFHPKGVWLDKRINSMSSRIIAISENVKEVLTGMEHVPEEKIHLLRHGFDLSAFREVGNDRNEGLKKKYNIPDEAFVIGVIARYTFWKGYEYLVPALSEIAKKRRDAYFIFANASGNDQAEIKNLIQDSLPEQRLVEIEFEADITALYKLFDVYVHVPFDSSVEAFGQTYVEALASGIPSVFTLSGIASEFIQDGFNALVVPFRDSKSIVQAINRISEDEHLRSQLISNGYNSVRGFALSNFLAGLSEFYKSEING